MPIDPGIPLQANAVIDPSQGLNALAQAYQYRGQKQQRAQQTELTGLQIANEKFKQLDDREQRRLKSTILSGAQLHGYLQNNDVEGAMNFLQTRKQDIETAKKIDPAIDSNETDQALEMLKTGKTDQLKNLTQQSIQLGQQLKFLETPEKTKSFAPVYDANGKIVAQKDESTGEVKSDPRAEQAKPTELARLIEERAALPSDSPHRAAYDEAIKKQTTHQPATSVTVNPNGPLTPYKTTQGKIDDNLMESGGRMMRLDSIAASFKPEYQTIGTRIGAGWSALKEKGGVNLSGGDQRTLTEFSRFKSESLNNLNLYIKEITGAAMSEAEADRIRKAMPDPGSGMFDGDSPTQFKAKLDDSLRQVKMAEARNVYLKRNGMSLMGADGEPLMALDRMPSLINGRGKEIEAGLLKADPKADKKAVHKAVMRQLGQEFGIATD